LQRHLRVSIFAVGLFGTALIIASLCWNISQVHNNTLEQARIQARVAYEEDIVYRRWNAMQGGVYVKVSDRTPPNRYLSGVPDRDITTTKGEWLTLVNPAYMTRQAHEFSENEHSVKGHLTSLKPIRPENKPDEWEWSALLDFEDGAEEVSSVAMLEGKEYLRLMKPLVAEKECLGCHVDQAYAPGEIRGGISVGVPMKPLRTIERANVLTLIYAHFALWTVGFGGLLVGGRLLVRAEQARSRAEEDLSRYARQLEESNRLKDLFTDIMRHDLLNPTGIISCYADFILKRDVDARTRDFGNKIKNITARLIQMIDNASSFTLLSETESIECGDLDLGAVIGDSLLEVREFCRDAEMEMIYKPSGDFPIRANPMIGNVFTNLLSNAAKYAGAGKRVEIDIKDTGGNWTVSVKDFGGGIPEEDKERIFCRFERLGKEGVKGLGLGLAISRHLVELHDGTVWAEDNPVGGTVFMVSLPKDGPRILPAGRPRMRLLKERIPA
jgi:signal transduction histidine kinase